MGMFSSLFGSSGSDKADRLRQQAVDAFNSIKTPQLSDLQVQLDKEVSAGTLTPEQAEAQLLNSNAFNQIATDPSLTGAAKQALTQLQQIGTQGGMTAIDKAQLQDITNATNQLAQSRNAAVLQNARERGIGGSGLELANTLSNEQAAADRASAAGTTVAANAQQRALQAIQAAGGLGQSLESQAYGEQANKAAAQNAINQFNAQTANATNLYNVGTANQAQAQNLANAQNIANTNTGIANANKEYNAAQNQTVYNDALQKASGIANIYGQGAAAADKQAQEEAGANMGLLGGALRTGGTILGSIYGGPVGGAIGGAAGGAAADMFSGKNSGSPYASENSFGPITGGVGGTKTNTNQYGQTWSPYAEGGVVHPEENKAETADQAEPENKYSHECYSEFCLHPEHTMDIQPPENENKALTHAEAEPENKSLEDEYNDFVRKYAYGGTVRMADGGTMNIKPANKEPKHMTPPHAEGYAQGGKVFGNLKKGALHKQLHVPSDKPIPSGKLDKALHSDNETLRKRAQFAENAKHFHHAEGGMIEMPKDEMIEEHERLIPQLEEPEKSKQENELKKIHDMRFGGQVPGVPKVPGNSLKNDIVPAKLSPGEIVVPRTSATSPIKAANFVKSTLSREEPTSLALRRLRNAHLNQGA